MSLIFNYHSPTHLQYASLNKYSIISEVVPITAIFLRYQMTGSKGRCKNTE